MRTTLLKSGGRTVNGRGIQTHKSEETDNAITNKKSLKKKKNRRE